MRRPLLALLASAALLSGAGLAAAEPLLPVPPVVPATGADIRSSNVTHVGTVPLEGVGVSMKVVRVGKQLRAFVSGAAGLSIYDATDPAKPLLLGHLPMYNWENEDIAVSADGKTAFLTEFQGILYLHVVDVSNPALPRITGTLAPGGAHTVVCANKPCTHLYGSEGQTYDVSDRTKPVELPRAQSWGALTGAGTRGHNLHQDAAGIWISDTSPLVAFRQIGGDPLRLRVLSRGQITKDTGYQHNNIRPRADQYKPRKKGESLGGPLRPGELLLGNGETNFTGRCSGDAGAFSTWSMAGFDRGVPMKQLDVLRPVSGNVTDGNPAANSLGCSGHWFTEKTGSDGKVLVTAAWYEHGTRFLSVDPKNGKITQVGFYQPLRGSTSQAYWMPGTDYVWSVDFHSGIDILRFDQKASRPSTAQIDASWLARAGQTDPFSELMRSICRAGGDLEARHHQAVFDLGPQAPAAPSRAARVVADIERTLDRRP